ncbi:hypothetical protein HKX54_15325 [Sulfitobacter sp. M57]|nr:hypothetical protein [Sulfitobacter sp. KE5]MDF3423321.1 hypothetical protein [Sulfitobacter sp. KE43]MDF3434387.1 hypothetical protein [Sulfitobacter sp. KE42]MDF3460027.1 hypothetical protein [Sulfitobacter sp. S74]MDF3463925.1 hypothetical protein [Sulfitobacter sp. Ks18]MDF3467985.1 hypothetical protein [Sulfitobacter sp. M05]MDF3471720.1 hypothetical protein [Sulfitobacter sp. M28]MDF3475469.1 hypothetical protein [Sulfitobacter sp. M48]MDF3479372.1 hypothetical protein [Sulfitobact
MEKAIHTPICDLFEIEHPVLLAPMARVSSGALAAAVSQAGGLGLVGGRYSDPDCLEREFDAAGDARIGVSWLRHWHSGPNGSGLSRFRRFFGLMCRVSSSSQ